MAPKKIDLQKQREARAKKALFVLVPVLVLLGAWQGPKVLKQLRGEAAAAPAAQTATTDATTGDSTTAETGATDAGTTDAGTTSEPGATGGAPTAADEAAAIVAAGAPLSDTDGVPAAGEGQLVSFSRFEARDPFVQLVDDEAEEDPTAAPTEPSSGTSTGTATGGSTPGTTTSSPPPVGVVTGTPGVSTPPVTTPPIDSSAARISVNGQVNVLVVGDQFPANDPVFKLVAIHGDSVQIGLVSGSFAEGIDTVTLSIGEPLTLISQPDGARFTLKLLGGL